MAYRIAVVWRGDRTARQTATAANNRFCQVFAALAARGIAAEPAVFDEDFAEEVRDQLLAADGVLVWVDPIHQGKTRAVLDAMLREVAARGPWVSAHPDAILAMGVKEVLYRTRQLGWGTDTHLYRSAAEFAAEFPARLRAAGPRVLKRNRGNGGQGVWKVELVSDPARAPDDVRVLEARRGSTFKEMPLAAFMTGCDAYFAADGAHRRSAVSAAPRRGHDPLLYGRRQGRRLWPSAGQGAGAAAARGPGLAAGAARPAHHARPRCRAVSGAAEKRWKPNGRRR